MIDFKLFISKNILNFSKNRKFPENYYTLYNLKKSDIGKYLNTWFEGINDISKDGKILYKNEICTLKKVDNNTALHLYRRKYNPIKIMILCPVGVKFKQNNKEDLYNMKAMICSIDDSSYGIWYEYKSLIELQDIRIKIMKWINEQKIINGEQFLLYNMSFGANKETIDYN
jgi:hypothetical protein